MNLTNGSWQIQGIDVEEIRKEFGSPLYVYDGQAIEDQIQVFQSGFSTANIRIKYACKALSNLSILKIMLKNGTGLDTVSIPEVKMGLSVGFRPEDIVFTPNCVGFHEIEQGIDLGVTINIENLSNLEKLAKKYGDSVPVCIRLNPMMQAHNNDKKVIRWHSQSKFGISIDQIDQIKNLEEEFGLQINGIHIHSSSVIMSTEVFLNAARTVFDVAIEFQNLKFIDFGGGIKLDVGDGHGVIDVKLLGQQLDQAFKKFCKEYGRDLELWFEPGRFLVGNAGFLFTTCMVRKKNGATEFAGVDSGFNHLIRPMFYDAYHHVINASNPDGIKHKYTVVGNICEIDNLAKDREISEISEGDLIIFKSAGAYGYSMASTYNSRYRPAEVLIHRGQAHLIRKADHFDDLIRNQVLIDI